ncbi:hypothetical protein CKO45_11755 [Paracraurococcus ruber]|uniref:Polysaccharide pyruvyl transferase domain-containing protein n=1 Tax=Paracraurococcus ruber TaxID=77675 RepID=A0ABS1CX58_9PROT|nr:hypothetical protein [Paracraurococcus ruber]
MDLDRPPESEAAAAFHAGHHPDLVSLIRAIRESPEATERRRRLAAAKRMAAEATQAPFAPGALRVLLFGAYGNGNLGDAAQAQAVAGLLRGAVRRPLDIRACSWIDDAEFPFDAGRIMRPDTIAEPAALREFDLVVVGGGGLLAPVHYPLEEAAWVRGMPAWGPPHALVGLGAVPPEPGEAGRAALRRALFAGAAFASLRDPPGQGDPSGVAWMADPVLLAGLLSGGGQPRMPAPRTRPLLIVKHPVHPAEAAFLDAAAAAGDGVDLVAMEWRLEQELAARFPRLRFVTDMACLRGACAAASVVVSARYHGCIAAVLEGVPCLGLGASKNRGLFAALGAPGRYLEHCGDLPAWLAAPPPPLDPAAFAPLRAASEAALARLAALVEGLPARQRA